MEHFPRRSTQLVDLANMGDATVTKFESLQNWAITNQCKVESQLLQKLPRDPISTGIFCPTVFEI